MEWTLKFDLFVLPLSLVTRDVSRSVPYTRDPVVESCVAFSAPPLVKWGFPDYEVLVFLLYCGRTVNGTRQLFPSVFSSALYIYFMLIFIIIQMSFITIRYFSYARYRYHDFATVLPLGLWPLAPDL